MPVAQEGETYLKADAIIGTVEVGLCDEILDRVEELLEGGALCEPCFEHDGRVSAGGRGLLAGDSLGRWSVGGNAETRRVEVQLLLCDAALK